MVGFNALYMPSHNKIDSRVNLRTRYKKGFTFISFAKFIHCNFFYGFTS